MNEEHSYFSELALISVDNQLTEDENKRLNNHLASCADCRRRKESATALSKLVASEPVPDSLVSGILYKITIEPSPKSRWRNFLPKSFAVAAACLALVVYIYQSSLSKPSDTLPPTETAGQDTAVPETYGIMPASLDEGSENQEDSGITFRKSFSVAAPTFFEGDVFCGMLLFYDALPEELSDSSDILYLSDTEARVVLPEGDFTGLYEKYGYNVFIDERFVSDDAQNGLVILIIQEGN